MSQFLRYISVFFFGVLITSLMFLYHNSSIPTTINTSVFKAILNASSVEIQKQNLNCEIKNPNKNKATVFDFIYSYLAWSQAQTKNSFTKLSCEDEKIQQCQWSFGEAKTTEGWSRILKFKYDTKSQSIIPNSLICIDVP